MCRYMNMYTNMCLYMYMCMFVCMYMLMYMFGKHLISQTLFKPIGQLPFVTFSGPPSIDHYSEVVQWFPTNCTAISLSNN